MTSLTASSILFLTSQAILEIEFYDRHATLDVLKLQWLTAVGLTDV